MHNIGPWYRLSTSSTFGCINPRLSKIGYWDGDVLPARSSVNHPLGDDKLASFSAFVTNLLHNANDLVPTTCYNWARGAAVAFSVCS
jgi:hypothetical protein